MYKNRPSTITFPRLALAGFFALAGGVAQAQTFTLQNNQLQITGGSGTTFSSQTQTISSAGVVGTFIDVPSTNGVGIPSFNFTIVPDSVPNGSYDFRVAVTIDDDANDRRMEAKIEKLTLTVAGTTITGTIPVATNPNGLRVLGRDGSNTLQVALNVANDQASGPITVSGGTVSFNASTLIDRIRSSTNTAFDTYILKEFDQPATYTYRIAVQQTSGPTPLNFGTTQPAFTALPKVAAGDVVPNTVFLLNTNELATGFTSAPTVTGKFNVVFVASGSSGGGGGGGTTNVATGTTELTDTVNNIVIPTTGPVSDEVVSAVNTAVETTNNLLTSASEQIAAGTLTPTQALTTLTAANSALDKAGTAKSTAGGSGVSSSASTTAVTNIANVVGALAKSTTPLTDAQKEEVATIVTSTVTSATKLLTADTPRSEILGLVEATAKLLQSSSDATGSIKDALATQLRALSTSASAKITASLPASIRGNVDLNSIDALRQLTASSPATTKNVVKSSPKAVSDEYFNDDDDEPMPALLCNPIVPWYPNCLGSNAVLQATGGQTFEATSATDIKIAKTGGDGQTLVTYGDSKFAAYSIALRIVPDLLADGTHAQPDGSVIQVASGFGYEITTGPIDRAGFAQAVTAAGFTSTYESDGSVNIDLGDGQHFSGAFALDDVSAATGACGTVSFTAPTGAPTAADYAFLMKCSNGVEQRVTPYPDNADFYDVVNNAGFEVTTDRNTGIITIKNLGSFKPSFFVSTPTLADTAYLNANKTAEGVAVRAADANGDGKTDYEILSANGVQVLYGL